MPEHGHEGIQLQILRYTPQNVLISLNVKNEKKTKFEGQGKTKKPVREKCKDKKWGPMSVKYPPHMYK